MESRRDSGYPLLHAAGIGADVGPRGPEPRKLSCLPRRRFRRRFPRTLEIGMIRTPPTTPVGSPQLAALPKRAIHLTLRQRQAPAASQAPAAINGGGACA